MSRKYKILVKEIYCYEIEVDANNKTDAINKGMEKYLNSSNGTFVADATSFINTDFIIGKS